MLNNNIDNIVQLLYGHHKFIERNTGDTIDPTVQHYVVNNQGVLANNRHFINYSAMEGQPNGDGTTEGQSLLILGYIYAYLATNDPMFLDKAKWYWDAYHQYFYAGRELPDPPTPLQCNWIVNAKEPILANWPLADDGWPTHGGFKGVEFTFTNGQCKIPHGAPYYGQFLDKVTFAFKGALAWNQINASVKALLPDGSVDWDTPGEQYDVDWIIDFMGRKIDWDGNILAEGFDESEKGTVQLKNTTINGVYKLNFANRQPVEYGGVIIQRNEMQHNRPLHVPIDLEFADNASDAELWFSDASYLLYKITKERKHYLGWKCSLLTCYAYGDIDSRDKFFRQSTIVTTPFTDGISYEYFYPSDAIAKFGRNSLGYITIRQDQSAQSTMEQQAIWFRVNADSKLLVDYGGVCDDGKPLSFKPVLELSKTKNDHDVVRYRCGLPESKDQNITHSLTPLSAFVREKKADGSPYIIADSRIVVPYGAATSEMLYSTDILVTRRDTINQLVCGEDDGAVIGFWLLATNKSEVKSFTYRSYEDDYNIRIVDDNGWRWWWMIPATHGEWTTITLSSDTLRLSGYQPNHPSSDPRPDAPVYSELEDITILPDTTPVDGVAAIIDWYCINDIPELYTDADGDDYTMTFSITIAGESPYTAQLGDCVIKDYLLNSLHYTPGTIPFSNITDPYANQYSGWRGLPYPGYQYPVIYCFKDQPVDNTRLGNMLSFMKDSQTWFTQQFGTVGPCAQAYVWNRWDNLKYGEPDTFTMLHWGDQAWSGYEPRAFFGAARAWQELAERGIEPPADLVEFCENWIHFLIQFQKDNDGRSPTIFNKDGTVEGPDWDFTGHMCGLWLAGACAAGLAGCKIEGLTTLADNLVLELQKNYVIVNPGSPMNGSWSPAVREGTDNGMFFGFWAGEIMRGLGLYSMYRLNTPNRFRDL
ncbi:tail formation protein [Salmonella phage SD-1_S14]|nr:tail formation protein [Salmonella phage SD-6_S16]WPK19567.1 tail formation protein [Salmonella phage SD-1_S14]HCN3558673.1 hypothetical protein [Escherichia coli]